MQTTGSPLVGMGLLKLMLLICVSSGLCQRDCTGVDCPLLQNCIDEVLEVGACCASCVQTGCMCEGYQYYDCVNAGFQKGKVPEGESYFVDFGSTECSCPMGGGRISCHFIPCPELPPNCIEMSEPVDGCIQCERIGCVYKEQKYQAGHSFHMDPCQVCHCPNDGGKLMCYPILDCDPRKVHKPVLATTTEENPLGRRHKDPIQHIFNHQGSRGSISKPFPVSHSDSLPAFKVNPRKSHMDEEEEEEDYDYPTTDSLEPSMHNLVSPTESSIISDSYPENVTPHQVFHRGTKQELKERFGFHEATTDRPWFSLHKERADEGKYTLHKGNPKKDILSITEDETRGAKFNIPDEYIPEKLPAFREMTYEEQFSIDRDTSERQSFSLYKGNVNEEALEKSNTDSEGLAAPTGTTDAEMFDLYGDTTHSEAVTDSPVIVDVTTPELLKIETTPTWQTTRNTVSSLQNQSLTTEAREHYGTQIEEDITKEDRNERMVMLSNVTDINRNHGSSGMDGTHEENTVSNLNDKESTSTSPLTSEKALKEHGSKPESYTIPSVRFSPTSQPALRVKAEERQPPTKQSQSLFKEAGEEEREERENTLSSFPKAHEEPSDQALLKRCCESGQKWASEHQHCNHLPTLTHHNSVCGAVQEQCCAGTLRESRCLTGINAAKAGEVCEESNSPLCGEDTQKECCSCCALGLRLRQEGKGCDVHQHLIYPCGHIFLTCCEEEEEGLSTPVIRRREKPKPTLLPKRVAERQFPKQPFSIEDSEHAANSVEKLEDVDECQRYGGQLCHHTCINTPGSYRCACHPGYLLLQDGHTCARENPEEENRVKEEDGPFTLATPTQETTPQITPLHNPCAGNGPCSQQCSVVRGKAQCSCFPGFSLKADGQNCEDFNECVTNTHTCLPDERCVNTVGAFVCERQISCRSGYQLRNGVCEDIDECVLRSHNCAPGLQCQNTLGSFHCSPKQQRCLTGFTQDPHGNCIDVDECSALSEPCTLGFNCINTVGSYTCQRKIMTCSRGFHSSPDGARCIDVDECVMGTHRCGEGQVCHNTPGSFRCDCQTGYQYDSSRRTCVDVNECWRFPGRLCAQSCENTPGSYQCSCTTGFSLAFDGKNCEDLNECDSNPCSQECANVYGSYQCYCRLGYYLKEDGHTCEDIDECSQSIGNLCAFQCVNVPGSYQCACPPQGYSMSPNGRTCRDIDECATGVHNCSATQTCYNIQGSFRCLSFTCPENYRKVSDTRCERVSCPSFQNCQNMPLRITYYQLSFQTNIVIPAQIFRIGPSPAYSGDNIIISILRGNEEGYFSTRRLNSFTGAVYLQRQIHGPRDFLIDVEMKLLRQGTFTTFLARIYVFITAHSM